MQQFSRWAWLCAGLASIGLATMATAEGPTDLGKKKVEDYFRIRPKELIPLIKGTRQVQDSDKKNIELAAEVLVWRTSWPVINTNSKIMDGVRKQFDEEMRILLDKDNRENNKAYRKVFAKYLIGCFKEVFNLPFNEQNRVGCVNAALLLPKLARLNDDEEIGDFLAELVKDPKKHDAIKLEALKGLAAFFPANEWTIVPPANVPLARKKRDIERIKAVLDFLDRTWESNKADDDAIRFLRREAIRTLGQAQVPAVEVNNQKVDAPVAIGLLKILDPKNAMTPPPSLQEKLEAAIGICQIKLIPNSDYLPDMGIYRVGKFLVDFANAYKNDRRVGSKSIPWKTQSERLFQALKAQVKNTQVSEAAQKKAQVLLDAATPYLNGMKSNGDIDRPKDLGDVVNAVQPKTAAVFKGLKPGNDN